MASDRSLLPPNATALERALASAGARVSDVPVDVTPLWDPATCPSDLLPWLAWALSIDRWSVAWSDAQRRDAIASAIERQRRKGTPQTMRATLARLDELLELVEWFEETPHAAPHTFTVRLPAFDADGTLGGERLSAATARAIVAEISAAKPVRSHFTFVQSLFLDAAFGPAAAAQATSWRRVEVAAIAPAVMPWAAYLQDENGEPLADDFGIFIDGEPA